MGGQSTGTFEVEKLRKVGVFNGTCAIVPSLKAPGFCKTISKIDADISKHFNERKGTIQLMVSSTTPEFKGFHFAWAAKGVPKTSFFGGGSFKAPFALTGNGKAELVKIPFENFSYDWSGYTGGCDTKDPNGKQHHCCSDKDNFKFCPTEKFLSEVTDMEIWAEGSEGNFHLEIEWVGVGDI
jgi:hypothetical protein